MNAARTTSAGNRTLSSAKAAKQDEFYTQLSDIENELKHYREHLRGKVILCNCDDPFESDFFKCFAQVQRARPQEADKHKKEETR